MSFRVVIKNNAVYYNKAKNIFIFFYVDNLYFIGEKGAIEQIITRLAVRI